MAQFIPAANYTPGRQGVKVDRIVIHWIVGNLAAADATFQNPARQASAHYGVEEGTVHQYVRDEDTAWHAGDWSMNLRSIGIEHSGGPGRPVSSGTYETSSHLIASLCKKFGIPCDRSHIIKHNEVSATTCPGDTDLMRLINRAAEVMGGVAQPSTPPPAQTGPAVINWVGKVGVVNDTLMVRSAPNTGAASGKANTADGNLHKGDVFDVVGYVQAQDPYGDGRNIWLKTVRGNWVWAGGTNFSLSGGPAPASKGGRVTVTVPTLLVRSGPGRQYAAGRANTPDGALHQGNVVDYVEAVAGESVNGNNVWYKSVRGNYFWSGGTK